jgi:hypothetical protein
MLITVAVHDSSLKSTTIAAFTFFQIHLTTPVSITGVVHKAAFKKNKKKTNQFVIYISRTTNGISPYLMKDELCTFT